MLDLRELAFIDGRGMRAIIAAGARAQQAGRRLVLVRVPERSRVARSLFMARHRDTTRFH